MAKRKKIKLRYGIIYLLDARVTNWRKATYVHGATAVLVNAIGQAARHIERSTLIDGEYAKAIVYDREEERVLFIYSRTADGIARKDYRNERRVI